MKIRKWPREGRNREEAVMHNDFKWLGLWCVRWILRWRWIPSQARPVLIFGDRLKGRGKDRLNSVYMEVKRQLRQILRDVGTRQERWTFKTALGLIVKPKVYSFDLAIECHVHAVTLCTDVLRRLATGGIYIPATVSINASVFFSQTDGLV